MTADLNALTCDHLRARLKSMGVHFALGLSKANLVTLLSEAMGETGLAQVGNGQTKRKRNSDSAAARPDKVPKLPTKRRKAAHTAPDQAASCLNQEDGLRRSRRINARKNRTQTKPTKSAEGHQKAHSHAAGVATNPTSPASSPGNDAPAVPMEVDHGSGSFPKEGNSAPLLQVKQARTQTSGPSPSSAAPSWPPTPDQIAEPGLNRRRSWTSDDISTSAGNNTRKQPLAGRIGKRRAALKVRVGTPGACAEQASTHDSAPSPSSPSPSWPPTPDQPSEPALNRRRSWSSDDSSPCGDSTTHKRPRESEAEQPAAANFADANLDKSGFDRPKRQRRDAGAAEACNAQASKAPISYRRKPPAQKPPRKQAKRRTRTSSPAGSTVEPACQPAAKATVEVPEKVAKIIARKQAAAVAAERSRSPTSRSQAAEPLSQQAESCEGTTKHQPDAAEGCKAPSAEGHPQSELRRRHGAAAQPDGPAAQGSAASTGRREAREPQVVAQMGPAMRHHCLQAQEVQASTPSGAAAELTMQQDCSPAPMSAQLPKSNFTASEQLVGPRCSRRTRASSLKGLSEPSEPGKSPADPRDRDGDAALPAQQQQQRSLPQPEANTANLAPDAARSCDAASCGADCGGPSSPGGQNSHPLYRYYIIDRLHSQIKATPPKDHERLAALCSEMQQLGITPEEARAYRRRRARVTRVRLHLEPLATRAAQEAKAAAWELAHAASIASGRAEEVTVKCELELCNKDVTGRAEGMAWVKGFGEGAVLVGCSIGESRHLPGLLPGSIYAFAQGAKEHIWQFWEHSCCRGLVN